jgi:serine/threonine protein kinase/Tol biopolymer transport system component
LIGQTLSHYRVTAALGAGGMGEVYRATDTTLGRDVAIKVLPPEVAQDPERLGRFRREAHLLASLNHPSIAAIYGLEEAEGKPFLALELVEGEDLKQHLSRGAIPVDEALEIAEQIAEALEEAHSKGIVHRDLKPANVKLAPGGKVKVLDFGLAKAWAGDTPEGSSPSGALSQSPTLAHTGTVAGVILGTAAYMSPEQARGKAVDRRADIWSFGVLLWEMLSGKALFAGDTVTDVIAAVVTKEPDLAALPKATPPAVRRLLSRCLRKDPRTRLPDIGAARLELQDVLAGTAAEAAPSSADIDEVRRTEHRSRSRERWLWAVALVVAAGLASLFAYRQLTATPEPRPPAHFTLDTPEDLSFSSFDPVAVSPDGRHVAFVGTSPGGNQQLWMRSLDSPEARPLPGTEGADSPFWSADSAELAFVAGGEIRKLVLTGGTVQRLCALPEGGFTGGTWSSKGTIVFSTGAGSGRLYSVSEAGGEAKTFTSHDESRGETGHWWPQFLPDARHILFQVGSTEEENTGLHVTSLEAPGERRRIRPEGARFRYAAPGALLFVQDGILLAQHFDARTLATMGDAVPFASSVASFGQVSDWGWFSVSATGRLAWLSGRTDATQLEWIDRNGRQVGTLGEPGTYGQIALSPDDRRVVAELAGADGQYDLWVIDAARGVPSRLTTDPANDRDPVWSPDSQEIVYSSDASGDQNLLRKGLQGSEPPAPLPGGVGQTAGERDIAKDWFPEDNTLLYLTIGPERTLWRLSLDGQGQPEALVKGFNVDQPHVSPDGRWLAYISQESGRWEVYVEPFGRRGERVRVSTSGGGQPRWRGDGKELFYLSLDGALMAVNVRAGDTSVEVELPTTLVPGRDLQAVVQGPDYTDYSVTSDGQRFLVKRSAEGGETPRIHVLLDWPSLLE